jgi:hypothetical protein
LYLVSHVNLVLPIDPSRSRTPKALFVEKKNRKMILLLSLLIGAAAAGMKFIDSDYVATVQSFESSTGALSLAVHRTSSDPRETVVSGSLATTAWNGAVTISFTSNLSKYAGAMFLTNYTTQSSCSYIINGTLGAVFDFSSSGWLAHPNTTATQLASGQVMLTLSCASIYNSTSGTYENINAGWCYDVDLSRGQIATSMANGASRTMSLVVDGQSGLPAVLIVSGYQSKSSYAFLNFTTINKAPVVDADPSCLKGSRCTNNTSPIKIQLYRQHGNSTLFKQLNNTNLASLYGEAYWLCEYHVASPLLSVFTLTVDARWSAYSLCNAGQCSVTDYASAFGVGRQFNDGNRVCNFPDTQEPDDSNVTCSSSWCQGAGTWYSFPQLGACPLGQPVGTNGCTWQQDYVTIKTITLDCLKNVSYLNFDCGNQTFGFMSSELARGFKLCPDVKGSVGDELSAEEFFASDQRLPGVDEIAEREASNVQRFGATPAVPRAHASKKRAAHAESVRHWQGQE